MDASSNTVQATAQGCTLLWLDSVDKLMLTVAGIGTCDLLASVLGTLLQV